MCISLCSSLIYLGVFVTFYVTVIVSGPLNGIKIRSVHMKNFSSDNMHLFSSEGEEKRHDAVSGVGKSYFSGRGSCSWAVAKVTLKCTICEKGYGPEVSPKKNLR